MEEWVFFDVLREIILWTTPFALLTGLILLVRRDYSHLEKILSREYGLRRRLLPKIESNIYIFHEWCLQKRVIIGLACIIYAVIVFSLLRRPGSLGEVIGDLYY